ncbi:hypothetical protein KKB18_06970, partial [bacterium]|nr:hypothetical protein [bacterium]
MQYLIIILPVIIIAYSSVKWTNQVFFMAMGILLVIILTSFSYLTRLPLYFLFTYVIWGDLLYSIGYLYLSKQYGLPAGIIFDLPFLIAMLIFVLRRSSDKSKYEFDRFDLLISIFLLLIFFHLFNGIGKYPEIFNQTRGFLYYLLYFPFAYYFRSSEDTSCIQKIILWCSILFVFVAILDALGVLIPYQHKLAEKTIGAAQKWGLTLRFHTIIAAFGIAFFFLLLAYIRSEKLSKFSFFSIFLLICSMVIIIFYSMTRSYQVGFFSGILIYLVIDLIFMKSRQITKYISFVVLFLSIISALVLISYFYLPNQFEFIRASLTKRWDTNFIQKEKSLGRRFDE